MSFLLFLSMLFVIFETHLLSSSNPELYGKCSSWFECGKIVADFPFWGGNQRPRDCGHPALKLQCENYDTTIIGIAGVRYRVSEIHPETRSLMIARDDYKDDICPQEIRNTTLDANLFEIMPGYMNLTLFYGCPNYVTPNFSCNSSGIGLIVQGVAPGFTGCLKNATVLVPTNPPPFSEVKVIEALQSGFEVKWKVDQNQVCEKCLDSKGQCGSTNPGNETICYCKEPSNSLFVCPRPPAPVSSSPPPTPQEVDYQGNESDFAGGKLVIVVAGVVISLASLIALLFRRPIRKLVLFMLVSNSNSDIEALIRNYGTPAPKRYMISDIKKMTSSYKEKVGQGGYENVYKEGDKRALIYEFMPNGSLEKFIYKESRTLGWEKLYNIALGITQGLEYLHRGCNTRIMHFGIKPHNILLDQKFCPKIFDFGLSKLCTRDGSIMSMLEARGTIGYIALEVFSRKFGTVSPKSDVYSHEMMVLEMVGGKKSGKIGVSASSEYFPDSIYKDLKMIEKLELQGIKSKAKTDTEKKMILVGLWCTQTKPSNKPSIDKVIEMLEGSVESLPIPPKPFLSSPSKSTSISTVTSSFDDTIILVD